MEIQSCAKSSPYLSDDARRRCGTSGHGVQVVKVGELEPLGCHALNGSGIPCLLMLEMDRSELLRFGFYSLQVDMQIMAVMSYHAGGSAFK